jgi:hypothetical protein
MTDEMRKQNPENPIVGFFMNLFANYGGNNLQIMVDSFAHPWHAHHYHISQHALLQVDV